MKSFTWLEPQMLWWLILVPAAAVLKAWQFRRRRLDLDRFGDARLLTRQNPDLALGGGGGLGRAGLSLVALGLIVLAMARPAGDPRLVEETLTRTGADIMLVVDLSSSMKATDLSPNRLQAAKTALQDFISRLRGDRVGLTLFAGSVSLQSPLTLDYPTVAMMVDILSTDFLPVDGTAIGDALLFALDKIDPKNRGRAAIILLTDGENTRGVAPLEAAAKVKAAGTRVYTIGIGTPGGAKIPEGLDADGRPRYKMYQGEPVVTKLDEETLRRIAAETGGKYFYTQTSDALLKAYQEIGRLTQTQHTETKKRYRYREYYLWLLLPALLLLLLDLCLEFRAYLALSWRDLFKHA